MQRGRMIARARQALRLGFSTHRRYTEVDVGLTARYADYSRRRELVRRLRGVPSSLYYRNASDRYFAKEEAWEPRWDSFAEF